MHRIIQAIKRFLQQPTEKSRVIRYWFLTLSFLLLIPNLALLIEITFNQPLLTLGQRIGFVIEIYTNTFSYLFEPVTLSIVILSLVIAFNFAMIRFVRKQNRSTKGRLSGTIAMLVSSHCVACGGSLLAPLLSLISGTGSTYIGGGYSRLQALTVILNTVAILIALRSIYKVSPTIVRLTTELKINTVTGNAA